MEKIKHIAMLIRKKEDLLEGSRSSLGLSMENLFVHMFVLGVEVEMTHTTKENIDWLKDVEARCYSNIRVNAEKHGFEYVSLENLTEKLKQMDLIIPF